jgi:adenylate cyclase class IV
VADNIVYEAELRYIVPNPSGIVHKLGTLGKGLMHAFAISDQWFVPECVRTYSDHEEWLISRDATPVRIRTAIIDGNTFSSIEVKRPTHSGDFEVCREVVMRIEDRSHGSQLLEALGLRQIITLAKRRASYRLDNFCICHLDTYQDNTVIVEIETESASLEEDARVKLYKWAARLGLDNCFKLDTSAAIHLIRMNLKA